VSETIVKSIIPPAAKRPRGKTSVSANPRLSASASSAEPGAALARGVKTSSPRVLDENRSIPKSANRARTTCHARDWRSDTSR
jgi:hypothetical protein